MKEQEIAEQINNKEFQKQLKDLQGFARFLGKDNYGNYHVVCGKNEWLEKLEVEAKKQGAIEEDKHLTINNLSYKLILKLPLPVVTTTESDKLLDKTITYLKAL